jgi:hypothetical protein
MSATTIAQQRIDIYPTGAVPGALGSDRPESLSGARRQLFKQEKRDG